MVLHKGTSESDDIGHSSDEQPDLLKINPGTWKTNLRDLNKNLSFYMLHQLSESVNSFISVVCTGIILESYQYDYSFIENAALKSI